jgi:hypothetical protein
VTLIVRCRVGFKIGGRNNPRRNDPDQAAARPANCHHGETGQTSEVDSPAYCCSLPLTVAAALYRHGQGRFGFCLVSPYNRLPTSSPHGHPSPQPFLSCQYFFPQCYFLLPAYPNVGWASAGCCRGGYHRREQHPPPPAFEPTYHLYYPGIYTRRRAAQ